MKIKAKHLHFHFPQPSEPLAQINERLKTIMNGINDATAALQAVKDELAVVKADLATANATISKVGTETDGLLLKIQQLQEAAANAPLPAEFAALVQEVVDASAAVKIAAAAAKDGATTVDGKVEDAATGG